MARGTDKNDFGTGSVYGNILRLAGPMTLAQLVNLLYNIVDRVFIGHIPGASSDALSGVGLTLPLITMISAFTALFGAGGSPLFSMARGAGEDDRAQSVMNNSFAMLIYSGVVLAAFGLIFKKPILYLFGASSTTYPYAEAYLTIYLLGTVFTMISIGMNTYINAQGFAVTGMLTVSIGAVLNLILDPLFIFVFEMGVRGAALATVISQFVSAIWVLKFFTGKKAIFTLTGDWMHVDFGIVKQISALGLSNFIMSFTNGFVQMVCNSTLQRWGGDLYVGIMTVISSVRELLNMPVDGVRSGAQHVISFNYGAKKFDRTKKAILFMTILCTAISLGVWVLILCFPGAFIKLFNNSPELLESGIPAMHIYFFGIFMMALQFSGQTTFLALGKSKHAMCFSFLRKVVIVIPLTLLLPNIAGLGTTGVFLAEPISNFVGGTACFVTMILTVWPKLKEKENK